MPLRIAIMASGTGSNLKKILEHAASGRLKVTPVLALSNNPEAGAMAFAKDYGVPVWARRPEKTGNPQEDRASFDRLLLNALVDAGAQAVILAGYMRMLTPEFLHWFAAHCANYCPGSNTGCVMNVHPSLLPSFPGLRGNNDAVEYGAKISGCTVHFVTETMDSGPIIIQAATALNAYETANELMPRIHALEHRVYPQAIQWLAEDRLRVQGRSVHVLPSLRGRTAPVCTTGETSLITPGLEDF